MLLREILNKLNTDIQIWDDLKVLRNNVENLANSNCCNSNLPLM